MLISILAFLFVLAFSVTIHEIGHFIAAKICRIPVEKFSIGFGPPLIRIRFGETDFRIAYFPFGGYVKMAGDDEGSISSSRAATEPEAAALPAAGTLPSPGGPPPAPGFYDVPIYRRVIVVFAGPFFNIVSAIGLFIFIFSVYGVYVNPYLKVRAEDSSYARRCGFLSGDSIVAVNGRALTSWDEFVDIIAAGSGRPAAITLYRHGQLQTESLACDIDSLDLRPIVPPLLGVIKKDGPADKAGMKTGDLVLQIDSVSVKTWDDMVAIVRASIGRPLLFKWQRAGVENNTEITPVPFTDPQTSDTVGQIGAMMPLARTSITLAAAVGMGAGRAADVLALTLKMLWQIITGEISRKSLGGPIAIARLSGESARWGFETLLGLLAVISINLGLVNLFPIPAFDGGHIVLAAVEAVRRKRFARRTRLVLQQIGYALILLLIIYVTFNDITR